MKKIVSLILSTVLIFSSMAIMISAPVAPAALAASTYSDVRDRLDINTGWKFYKGTLSGSPQSSSYNDASWTDVSIPHTWNNVDGQNNPTSEGYFRGDGWYRKSVVISSDYAGKKLYIEFLGSNTVTTVWVNGTSVGADHMGGYTAFRYDITDLVKLGEANVIAVRVNNATTSNVAPVRKSDQSVDFTIYGGIYREVSIIVTESVHIDTTDNASSGVYISTPNVSKESATLNIKSKIVNDTSAAKQVTVTATLRDPDEFIEISDIPKPLFDVSTMYGGDFKQTVSKTFTVPAGAAGATFDETMTVDGPRLWNGLKDPYRYMVDFEVSVDGVVVDKISQYIGFRYFSVDNQKGFFLNGESYPLRGVNRHQDRIGIGNALTVKEHNEDIGLIYEMGVNALRLAHYPQAAYFYDLCDKYGIVVWAEIPFVTGVAGSGSYASPDPARVTFMNSLRSMLVEMIRQNYNCPSIMFWGLQNEVDSGQDAFMKLFMQELHDTAKKEDPYRLTTLASNTSTGIKWKADVVAWNRYDGWYSATMNDFATSMDRLKASETPNVPTGVSEYGAGANVNQHDDNPRLNVNVTPGGQWHPEEYQNIYHETYLAAIQARDWLWGTFVWNMFDFAMAGRNEGAQPGLNDKGLVTFDRKTKKDAFYLYKANWSSEPVVYISSRRYTARESALVTVKAYSNCDSLSLYVNDVFIAKLDAPNQQKGVFVFNNVPLPASYNTVKLVGTKDGVQYEDSVVWTKGISNKTDIATKNPYLLINNLAKTISYLAAIDVDTFNSDFVNSYNVTYTLYKADGVTEVTSGSLSEGMKLKVTAEDGVTTATYTIASADLAFKKPIKASFEQSGNPATGANDGDPATRWSGYRGATGWPEWIEVDLGAVYNIDQLVANWYSSSARYYQYTIWIKSTPDTDWGRAAVRVRDYANEGYTKLLDKSANTTLGNSNDKFAAGAKARYVVIHVNGGGGGATTGAIDLLMIYGWRLASDLYAIDDTAKTITATVASNMTPEVFMKSLNIFGNCNAELNSAGTVCNGDTLTITNILGAKTTYTLNLTLVPTPAISSLIVYPESKKLVSGLSASVKVELAGRYLEGTALTVSFLGVTADVIDGAAILNIPNVGDNPGVYNLIAKIDGVEAAGTAITVVPRDANLWVITNAESSDGKLVLIFADVIAAKAGTFAVTIDGKSVGAAISDDKLSIVTDVDCAGLDGGETVKVTGLKYPDLFPSYSFTITGAITK